MRRSLGFLAVLAAGLAACRDAAGTGPGDALAAGWSLRPDAVDERSDPGRFVLDGEVIEAKAGPNATLWHPQSSAKGDYRVSVRVTHLDSGVHPHGAGLTLGGSDVLGPGQSYTYFLVRCDRKFLIKTRSGGETAEVLGWTEHEAVAPENDLGVMDNLLTVEVRGEVVRFSINGKEVHRAQRGKLPLNGRLGLRLVHDIYVRFGRIQIEAL